MKVLKIILNIITLGEYFRYKKHKELQRLIDEYKEYTNAVYLYTKENRVSDMYYLLLSYTMSFSDVGRSDNIIDNYKHKIQYIEENFQYVPFVKFKLREKKINEVL